MNILFLLIPLSLLLLSLAIWAFFWAVKNDQFEDLEGPAYSILFDDDEPKPAEASEQVSEAKNLGSNSSKS
ncbi:MAG: cbb3-type cytochrome oxidase assembly protein CcoS [Pseudomonadaceae bacterium]|nr:cbb3-type cytochrome oxidase assembly protein CcoS [Pseudomonadaceae bacterium]